MDAGSPRGAAPVENATCTVIFCCMISVHARFTHHAHEVQNATCTLICCMISMHARFRFNRYCWRAHFAIEQLIAETEKNEYLEAYCRNLECYIRYLEQSLVSSQDFGFQFCRG